MTFDIITIKGEPSVIEDRAHESLMTEINKTINNAPCVLQIVNIETKMSSTSKTVSTITGVKQFTYTGIAHISIIKMELPDILQRYLKDMKHLQNAGLIPKTKLPWYKRMFKKRGLTDDQ